MKYTSAYMLLALGGKAQPTAEEVSELLTKSGIEVDANALSFFMEKMAGKSIEELLEAGKERLVAGGGGGGGGGAGGAGGAAAEEEVEEEEEEEEEEVEVGNMFGGDDDDAW